MLEGMDEVWYVSYGSNMSADRFRCYLEGGVPPGGRKHNPGARETTPPLRSAGIDLPGTTYFSSESPQWGGGVAFYDHQTPGRTHARGYLISPQQLADVAAQEMYFEPGAVSIDDAVLAPVEHGEKAWGDGHYETVIHLGDHDGCPMLTITAPHRVHEIAHTRPGPAYLDTMTTGLRETHGWEPARIDRYLDSLVTAD